MRETKFLSFYSAGFFFLFVKAMASLIGKGRIEGKEENAAMTGGPNATK